MGRQHARPLVVARRGLSALSPGSPLTQGRCRFEWFPATLTARGLDSRGFGIPHLLLPAFIAGARFDGFGRAFVPAATAVLEARPFVPAIVIAALVVPAVRSLTTAAVDLCRLTAALGSLALVVGLVAKAFILAAGLSIVAVLALAIAILVRIGRIVQNAEIVLRELQEVLRQDTVA